MGFNLNPINLIDKAIDYFAPPPVAKAKNFIKDALREKEKNELEELNSNLRSQLASEKARAEKENRNRKYAERALANERAKSQRLALIIKLAIFIGILYGIYHYFEFAFLDGIYESIKWLFVNIYDGIKWLVIKIYDGVVWILVSIYDGIKWVIVGIYDFIVGLFS